MPASTQAIRIVSLTATPGSGGNTVARFLARSLGWDCHDGYVDLTAAARLGVSVQEVERAMQHQSWFERVLESLSWTSTGRSEWMWSGVPMIPLPPRSNVEVRSAVAKAILDLAGRGDAVIAGHGAQAVLRNRPDVLHVLVTASEERRTSVTSLTASCSPDEARQAIRAADAERAAFHRNAHGVDWADASLYDMTLSTDAFAPARAAAMIRDVVLGSRTIEKAPIGSAGAPLP